MAQTEKNTYVTSTLAEIMTACTLVRNALTKHQSSDLADDLLTIYVAVDELLEFGLPRPSEGQLHGLPKKATTTHFSTVQFRHENNLDWDYQTWFAEKMLAAKRQIGWAVDQWQELKKNPTAELKEKLSHHVENCHTYADRVYQEVIEGRLEIKELSSE